MKALEKDRNRRFATALELAADIERHLTNLGLIMKIVVIGGSGLFGKKLVNNLRQHGHDIILRCRLSAPIAF